jgi:hypothetical protein
MAHRTDGNRQGDALQQRKVDVDVEPLRLEAGELMVGSPPAGFHTIVYRREGTLTPGASGAPGFIPRVRIQPEGADQRLCPRSKNNGRPAGRAADPPRGPAPQSGISSAVASSAAEVACGIIAELGARAEYSLYGLPCRSWAMNGSQLFNPNKIMAQTSKRASRNSGYIPRKEPWATACFAAEQRLTACCSGGTMVMDLDVKA